MAGGDKSFEEARVVGLFRYPVKAMAGGSLTSTRLGWHGLAGDRRWAFVRPGHESNGFPWLTLRQEPRMVRFAARLREPTRPDASAVEVTTPEGTRLAVTDVSLAYRLGVGLRLMRLHRGAFDSMPVSMIGTATVAELCTRAGVPIDARRFRPNLLVETRVPYIEDHWVGHRVRVGEVLLRVDQRDPRCAVVDVDPCTGIRAPGLLHSIAKERGCCAGVYATVACPGSVRVSDQIHALTEEMP